jgi:hypothetical protein
MDREDRRPEGKNVALRVGRISKRGRKASGYGLNA